MGKWIWNELYEFYHYILDDDEIKNTVCIKGTACDKENTKENKRKEPAT